MHSKSWFEEFMQLLTHDFRYGLRILRKSPGFTIVALLTLAIGIGAVTAIFSIVDAVLLRPLAMQRPERVMLLQELWQGHGGGGVSVGNYSDLHEISRSFSSLSASASAAFNLATEDTPERIDGEMVTADYFKTFGVPPLMGRYFSREEDAPGHNAVAIIGEDLWRTRFRGDSTILGRSIRVNGAPNTVVGVMPRSFDPLLSKSQIWVPAAFTPAQ